MKKILIADSSKASLVMTSEVFKDHYPGIQVLVAKNSAEAVQLAKSSDNIDAFIIDYDLPDLDGAKTALLLKKISKTPILITAFDREDVEDNIEKLLVKFDDCRSWLKKPVNPEVVIAVAQRFCDGKIRAQKRIPCSLPVLAQIEFVEKLKQAKVKALKQAEATKKVKANSKSKTKEISKDVPNSTEEANKYLNFYGVIEDCSLSGIKLKPSKNTENNDIEWSKLLEKIEGISAGNMVTLKIPNFMDIEVGKAIDLSKKLTKSLQSSIAEKAKKGKGKKIVVSDSEEGIQELSGKVVWASSSTGEWHLGIEFENQSLSKKLFEAIVSSQVRQSKLGQTQSIMKASRIM